MKQSYDSSIHTREGLESMVAGTFLSGNAGGGQGGAPSGGSSLAVPPVPAVQGRAPVPELKPVPVRERLPVQVTAARELRRYRQLHLSVIMR